MRMRCVECGARSRQEDRGLTLIELLVVIAIISILATAVMPLSRMTVKRIKETELRNNLRVIRSVIDTFNGDCIAKRLSTDYCSKDGYPESLEILTQPLTCTMYIQKVNRYRLMDRSTTPGRSGRVQKTTNEGNNEKI
jgi:prepilin-type N-terminal cleavage/methylation domain-containing protein